QLADRAVVPLRPRAALRHQHQLVTRGDALLASPDALPQSPLLHAVRAVRQLALAGAADQRFQARSGDLHDSIATVWRTLTETDYASARFASHDWVRRLLTKPMVDRAFISDNLLVSTGGAAASDLVREGGAVSSPARVDQSPARQEQDTRRGQGASASPVRVTSLIALRRTGPLDLRARSRRTTRERHRDSDDTGPRCRSSSTRSRTPLPRAPPPSSDEGEETRRRETAERVRRTCGAVRRRHGGGSVVEGETKPFL
ncbi:hypothetical protein THAOC_25189, partial [Thalassiosira oceanica]